MRQLRLPESVPAGIEVWRIEFDPTARIADSDWSVLSEDEGVRALRLRRHEDRVRSVVVRAALRRLLGARLHLAPHVLRFVTSARGKPALCGATEIEFNVSHAGSFALIALSVAGAVGVDIERCVPDIAGTDEEILSLHVLSPIELERPADLGFFERWVAKESALKALGLGVAEHLQSLTVLSDGMDPERRYRLQHSRAEWPELQVWPLDAPNGYAAALARASRRFEAAA